MGTDRDEAVRAARILNNRLLPSDRSTELLIARVEGGSDGLRPFVERFRDEILPGRRNVRGKGLAPKTLGEYQRMCDVVADEFGHLAPDQVTRRRIVQFFERWPANTANKYRALLRQLFAHAIAVGLLDENPVSKTLARDEIVKRQRLDYETFAVIRKEAEPWYRNAMDLALLTLQRRDDLVRIEFTMGDTLELRQGKTGTRLQITVGPTLADVVRRCRDDVPSPFLIHRRPKRKRAYAKQKQHWTAVAPEMLTREFARIRDDLGVCDHLEPAARPTFHEIRSLGADLYRQAEKPEPEIQRLLGHTTAAMTAHYLEGHDTAIKAFADLKWPE